jgi:hypothetical protein
MLRLVLFLAALIAAPAAPSATTLSLTVAEQTQLKHNLELGALLYRYDQSAWHVTDAMLATTPDDVKHRMQGYITTPTSNGLRTTFFGGGALGYQIFYAATWTGSKIENVEQYAPGQQTTLTEEELRLVGARKVALEAAGSLTMCSEAPPNVIVVPDNAEPTVHVYVLTPQTENGVYPLGGHHRIDVQEGRIVGKRAFTKSCISLSTNGENGEKPVAMGVTHLLDAVPTEIHVFEMLSAKTPLIVGTSLATFILSAPSGQPQYELLDKAK